MTPPTPGVAPPAALSRRAGAARRGVASRPGALTRAEAQRLRSSKALWVLPAVAVFLLALSLLGNASLQHTKLVHHQTTLPACAYYLVGTAFIVTVFSSIGGVLQVTSEIRSRSLGLTTLMSASRRDVLVAKASVAAAAGALYGGVAVAAAVAISKGALASYGYGFPVSGHLAALMALVVVVSALGGPWGVFLGALIRSQVPAVVAVVLYTTTVESLVLQFFPVAGRWLPGGAQAALLEDPSVHERLSRPEGAALVVAWLALAALVALPTFNRQEI